jgi:hypothetical protein
MIFTEAIKNWFYRNDSNAARMYLRIPLLDSSGNPIGCDRTERCEIKQPMYSGVFVVKEEAGYPRLYQIDQADPTSENNIGVAIFDSGHLVIISKGGPVQKKWVNGTSSGTYTSVESQGAAIALFDGKTATNTIMNNEGASAEAANWCATYYPANVANDNAYFGIGRWWLPSVGELFLIMSHWPEVRSALGAMGVDTYNMTNVYWTSTPFEDGNGDLKPWVVYGGGSTDMYLSTSRYSSNRYVLPVTSFY